MCPLLELEITCVLNSESGGSYLGTARDCVLYTESPLSELILAVERYHYPPTPPHAACTLRNNPALLLEDINNREACTTVSLLQESQAINALIICSHIKNLIALFQLIM